VAARVKDMLYIYNLIKHDGIDDNATELFFRVKFD
jgi:hypothetical protein